MSSSSESDASSSHSCELDLAIVGEAPGQINRSQLTANKMKNLKSPEPCLKLVKDYCFQGMVKASQRLSFVSGENLSMSKVAASFLHNNTSYEQFNFDSLLDMHPGIQSKTTNATLLDPFVLSPTDGSCVER